MTLNATPYRSVLYIPGSNSRALEKAANLETDAIIFDLEDAVSPAEKDSAREVLAQTLQNTDYGHKRLILRVNGPETPWGTADVESVMQLAPSARPDAILLPKVEEVSSVTQLSKQLRHNAPDLKIWAMMETPKGILNAQDLAASGTLEAFVLGTNDLEKALNSRSREALIPSLHICLLAARAYNLVCIDGVYNAFKDEEGLHRECAQGRDMGFDGKTLIHPAQLAIANDIYGPTKAELELARRQIDAFEQAQAKGQGVAVLDGKIVENLHVETAKQRLAQAEAITKLGGA